MATTNTFKVTATAGGYRATIGVPEGSVTASSRITGIDGTKMVERHNLAALRVWHRYLAEQYGVDLGTGPCDFVLCGDSIHEGWTGGGTDDSQAFGVIRRGLARLFNASGRYGRWVPGGGGWFGSDALSSNGGATEVNDGLSLRGRSMASTAAEAVGRFVTDKLEVHYRIAQIFAYGDLAVRVFAVPPSSPQQYLAGANIGANGLATPGFTLQLDAVPAGWPAAGTVVLTSGSSFLNNSYLDNAIITYTSKDATHLYGCDAHGSVMPAAAGSSPVSLLTPVTSVQLAGFDNVTTPTNQTQLALWSTGALTRGDYVIGIAQKTNGAFTGPSRFDGVYAYDGDTAGGVRCWNASHFGYNFASYTGGETTAPWGGYLSAIRKGYLKPRLWVWAHGTNESVTSGLAQLEARIRLAVAQVWAVCDEVGIPRCSQAFAIPSPSAGHDAAAWGPARELYYRLALELGIAVIDWYELTGPVDGTDGDPLGWTADFTHPGKYGQRAIGQLELELITRVVDRSGGMLDLQAQLDALTIGATMGGDLTGTVGNAHLNNGVVTPAKLERGDPVLLRAGGLALTTPLVDYVSDNTLRQLLGITFGPSTVDRNGLAAPVRVGDEYAIEAGFDYLNNGTGASTLLWQLKLGAVSLWATPATSMAKLAFMRRGTFEARVLVVDATHLQVTARISTQGGSVNAIDAAALLAGSNVVSGVNVAADATLAVNATHGQLDAATELRWHSHTVRRIGG